MAQHGGYRKPEHPAPVSGPGKYARRTDGHPAQVLSAAPDQDYGQQKAQLDAQRLSPMGAATPMPSAANPEAAAQGMSLSPFQGVPLDAPSQRPDEPVTHGVDIGEGAGPEVLNLPQAPAQDAGTGAMTALLQNLSATDATGILGQLMVKAQARNV